MRELLKSIESLNHLSAFEAAARLGSFTRAASELGVSQPAISQAVRKLENAIDTKLFYRRHSQIVLTDAGEVLYNDVSSGFGRILATIQNLQKTRGGTHVTLSVSTAFANYWMVPRLQDFHIAHPDIDLRMQTTDKDLDLAGEGISLGIWRGSGEWPGYDATLIAPEVLCAIASPQWISDAGTGRDPSDLQSSDLILLEEPYRTRPTWADLARANGATFRDHGGGLRLNDYALVLHAALAGEGVSLGWRHVTQRMINAGLLAKYGDWEWITGQGFYLVWPNSRTLSPDATSVRDWIVSVAAENMPKSS
jgi:DNA-binding transcriptional LysR family regulator